MERLIYWHGCTETKRFWIHFGSRNTFALEVGRPKFSIGFGVRNDWEHTISGDFCGFYWHIDCKPLRRLFPVRDGNFKFYWHEGGLWLNLWGDEWGDYSRNDPWWRKTGHLNFPDLILGKEKYSSVDVETFENVVIPMPEGCFRAKMTFSVSTRKRPRWFAKHQKWTDISLDDKAPTFPGKGENSWDIGDDAIYGTSVKDHSLPKAIGDYVRHVLEYREKRSGRRVLMRQD